MSTKGPLEFDLSPKERLLLDQISAQMAELNSRKTGILMCLASLHDLEVSGVNYENGKLIYLPAQPKGEQPKDEQTP